ncbi:related to pisatin demethylase (cytochrome P450) [Cephalotrichum gorgonifer]|uniref:Related to pisatin demethylase (Cytochrome P450) n=1 Tax=Cephalotrichum gorgonifer TaxID=2041049 RepID=A0AAE8SYN7_9PEZI|nr:related to pisatin demethylase (cytochrome P450) [Cephalotrichum gorgonifer]
MDLLLHETWSALLKASLDNWIIIGSAITLGVVAIEAVWTLYSWNRLRHIGGPTLAAFSNLWIVRAMTGGKTDLVLAEVNEKYGSLVRVGPNELLTSDPTLLRRINGVRSRYKRSEWYLAMRFDPARDNVLSQRDDELHNVLRTKMSAGYSGKEVDALEYKVDRNIVALINLLGEKYVSTPGNPRPVDFGPMAQYFTLDVISDIAYSEPFGCLASDSDILGYIQAVNESIPMVMLFSAMPRLNWILQSAIMKRFLPSDRDQLGFGRLMKICKQKASERFGEDKQEKRDMLGSFVRHGLTQPEAQSETLLQIMAGSETTATAIRATLLHLTTAPSAYAKLVSEITAASKTVATPIPASAARSLPYLQAVIKEGLRIWPPLSGVLSKITPPEGDEFNGLHIPGGTVVGCSPFGLSRNKEVWGEDANVFRPERWLEGTTEELREKEAALDLTFGHGKWQCLGKNIAYMELNKIFFELLRNFDIQVASPTKVWDSTCVGIFLQKNFWLIFTRRD